MTTNLAHLAHLAQQNEIARSISARAVKNLRKQVIAALQAAGRTSLYVEWSDGQKTTLEASPMGRLLQNFYQIGGKLSTLGVEQHTNRTEPRGKARLVGEIRGNAENYDKHYYLISPYSDPLRGF